jgi:hypothetical protein
MARSRGTEGPNPPVINRAENLSTTGGGLAQIPETFPDALVARVPRRLCKKSQDSASFRPILRA